MIRRLAVALVLCATVASCGKKAGKTGPAPEVTGLAAVPSNAEAVIGVDVAKVAGSAIVQRAAEQLLLRDKTLSDEWQQLRDGCKVEFTRQVKRLMLAIGPTPPNGRVGSGPVIMIAIANVAEADLVACVTKIVGKGGGAATGASKQGRMVYQVKDGARTMYFAFGRPDTVIMGSNEAYVLEALGPGKKALDNPELAGWIKMANQDAPIWAVGRFPEKLRTGFVSASKGKLSAGPQAAIATVDPTNGLAVQVLAVMPSADAAKQLESLANGERTLIGMVAQARSLGPVVERVKVVAEKNVLRLSVPLSMDDVNHLLSVLDAGKAAPQDSPPP